MSNVHAAKEETKGHQWQPTEPKRKPIINFIRVPLEGEAPKIVIPKSKRDSVKDPFEGQSKTDRKIWYHSTNRDRKRGIKAWGIPINWDEENVKTAFSVFGTVKRVYFISEKDLVNRHCHVYFTNVKMTRMALTYDSSSIVQPMIKGNVIFGVDKYLVDYINTRPRNIEALERDVGTFMKAFDKLQEQRKEEERRQPRRNRGWIQTREPGGFKKIHYPNKFERKKNAAIQLEKIDKTNDNDTYNDVRNAAPHKQVYNAKAVKKYYELEGISDGRVKAKAKFQRWRKQKMVKVRDNVRQEFREEAKQRITIPMARLKESLRKGKLWKKDVGRTTELRKHRIFKPM